MEQVKITLTPNGRDALEKVAQWLEAGAPHVLLDVTGRRLDGFDMEYGVTQAACGTSCCIAGAVYQFEGLGHNGSYASFWSDVNPIAKDFLVGEYSFDDDNISEQRDELAKLFLPWDYYENEYGENESRHFNDTERAAKVVRHLLATGYIDWTVAGYVESC